MSDDRREYSEEELFDALVESGSKVIRISGDDDEVYGGLINTNFVDVAVLARTLRYAREAIAKRSEKPKNGRQEERDDLLAWLQFLHEGPNHQVIRDYHIALREAIQSGVHVGAAAWRAKK